MQLSDASRDESQQALNEVLSDNLSALFATLSRSISLDLRGGEDTLSRADYTTLIMLERVDGPRLSELAEAEGLDLSTLSRRISSLVSRGLLVKTPDPSDGRAQCLQLTADGRQSLHDERKRRVTIITTALADWPADDKRELARLIGKLEHSLADRDAH